MSHYPNTYKAMLAHGAEQEVVAVLPQTYSIGLQPSYMIEYENVKYIFRRPIANNLYLYTPEEKYVRLD